MSICAEAAEGNVTAGVGLEDEEHEKTSVVGALCGFTELLAGAIGFLMREETVEVEGRE